MSILFSMLLLLTYMFSLCCGQIAAIALCLALALEEYWMKPPVEVRVDNFNRVTYEPKPSLT